MRARAGHATSGSAAAVALAAALALAGWAAPAPPAGAAGRDVVGIWKMCFEPGLPGVDEPSDGYLVLLPDRRYVELRVDCCPEPGAPPSSQLGTYRVEGESVVLRPEGSSGASSARRFTVVESAAVVLFDDLQGRPREATVLKIGPDLSYGFARIYPAPP